MNNSLHIYQMRHLFKGDDYLGKYDTLTKIVRIIPDFQNLRDEVKAFFMRAHGMPVQVLIGDEEIKHAAPLMEFPDEVRALMSPQLGDLTPEVVTYARQHFTAREFNRRYTGRQPLLPEGEAPAPEKSAAAPPKPATHAELKKLLKDKGIPFPGNAKTVELQKLWMDANIDAATAPPSLIPGAGNPEPDDEENTPD